MKHKVMSCGMIGLAVSINCGNKAEKYNSAFGFESSKIKPFKNALYPLPFLSFVGLMLSGPALLKIALNPRYKR